MATARRRVAVARAGLLATTAVIASALLLAGCSAKKTTTTAGPTQAPPSQGSSATPTPTPTVDPAALAITPAAGSTDVSPVQPIKVAVTAGTLTAVTVRDQTGASVKGAMSDDRTSWISNADLGYGKAYSVEATAANSAGLRTSKHLSFSTVTPTNMTMPYLNTAAGGSIPAGVTYGIGQVIKVHFDEPIPNKKAAEAALTVQTSPVQAGAFNWFDDQDVYWRSAVYLKPGTKVTISANVYGKNFGGGLYGQANASTWFIVGASHIAVADDDTKLVKVYDNGKLVRTMPTSMGRHATIAGDHGSTIDLRTNSGPHLVVDTERNIDMNSASFGLSTGPNSYKTTVPIGVRISYDGEYVHWAAWSVWAQGNTDTSHGCLNVSPTDAYWFAAYSQPGDIVDVKNTGRPLALWNSGYWTESFKQWSAGSAL